MAAANPDCFPINQLPDHILMEIFLRIGGNGQYLGRDVTDVYEFENAIWKFPYQQKSLLHPIASVCSRWRQLHFQPQMWRSKVVNMVPIYRLRRDSQFFTVLRQMAGEIHSLEILCCSSEKFAPLRLLPTFPNVEKLIFNHYSPTRNIELLVEKFSVVQTVTFGIRVPLNYAILLQMASGWENLRKLDIDTYWRSTDVTGTGLIRFVQLANHIESLNINTFYNLTDRDFDDVTMALGNRLKSITFGYNQEKLSDLAISSLLQNCPKIEQICLRLTLPIGRLKYFAHLRCLKLHFGTDFGNNECFEHRDCQGFEDLFSQPLPQLRSFVAMGVGNLTDSLMELIANSCPQLECLSLSLYSTSGLITDSGLAHIVNKCRNLRVLCLKGFPLLTGRSFIGAGAKLPNLSRLTLVGCENVDAEMVRTAFVRSIGLQIRSDLHGPWDRPRY